ncbi:MAG: hypothetical protein AB7D29_07725 [Campylobacterales bacterium]
MAADNTELQALKTRADELGVDYADNIGVKKLSERIAAREKELAESDETKTDETKTDETKTDETKKTVYIAQYTIMHDGKPYAAGKPLPDDLLEEKQLETLISQGVIKSGNDK